MLNNKHITKLIANALYVTIIILATSSINLNANASINDTNKLVENSQAHIADFLSNGGPPY